MKDVKYWFLDVETCGLNPKKNSIIQIASIFTDNDRYTREFEAFVAPIPGSEVDQKALEINEIKENELWGFAPAVQVLRDLKSVLKDYLNPYDKKDKFTLVGYNVRFDDDFMREWFARLSDKWYGSWRFFPPIDVMNLAAEYLKEDREELPDFTLKTVAARLGITVEKERLHDALYDVELTRAMYRKLTEKN